MNAPQTGLAALNWLHALTGFGGAGLGYALGKYEQIKAYLQTSRAKAIESDLQAAVPIVVKTLSDSGHPLAPATIDGINTVLNAAKNIPAALILAFLIGSQAHAGVSFGAVSPTASGAPLLEFQPLVTATFYKVGAGAVLAPSIDTVGGITVTENWGAYSFGLAGGIDKDTANSQFYLAGGIVAGILPYGMIEAFWKQNGCILGYTMPIGIGASVN